MDIRNCLAARRVRSGFAPIVAALVVACATDNGESSRSSADLAAACAAAPSAPPLLTPHDSAIWPPNHKFHSFSVADCVDVASACGETVTAQFIWASSDEPVDDLGDGHFAPDIELSADCTSVSLRAERQGPKDGRVYKLGVRVVDGSGQAYESTCAVIVDHDQRGIAAADSGESYRLTFDGTNGAPLCDGAPVSATPEVPSEPPTEPPAEPPATEVPDAGPEYVP